MIVQVRGTSGSGKSWVIRWVIRRVMERYDQWVSEYIDGRRKPLYYRMANCCVLGHYEAECGGCDTIGSARQVYELIQDVRHSFALIICEGLLLSEDTKWTLQLPRNEVRVLYLVTPIEKCLARIKRRRKAKGNLKPLNEYNTRNRVGVIERSRIKLTAARVSCQRVSQMQAVNLITMWIGESNG